MLAGVAPFAIEQGLIEAQEGTTTVRIHNVNTGATIESTVCTPGRKVTYEGDARIDGVAGTAAPILLNFLDAWGAVTGKVFPTGNRIDVVDGLARTVADMASQLPPGVKLQNIYDGSRQIRVGVNNVRKTLIEGSLLTLQVFMASNSSLNLKP